MHLDVTDPDSVKAAVEQTTAELGEIEVLVAGAGDTVLRQARLDQHRAVRVPDPDPPGWRQPGGHRRTARDDRTAARRPDLRRIRCRTASAAAHGRLRRRQGRPGGDGDQLPDGAGRHRSARVDRASRSDQDLDGLEPARRADRSSARGLGQVGPGAPRLLPARGRSRAGHHLRRRDTRAAASSRTWNSSPRLRWPMSRTARSSRWAKKGCRVSDD